MKCRHQQRNSGSIRLDKTTAALSAADASCQFMGSALPAAAGMHKRHLSRIMNMQRAATSKAKQTANELICQNTSSWPAAI